MRGAPASGPSVSVMSPQGTKPNFSTARRMGALSAWVSMRTEAMPSAAAFSQAKANSSPMMPRPPTGRIHGAAVHRGVGAVGQPLPFQGLIGGLGLVGVAEHGHHASLVHGDVGSTCRHVGLPGAPVGIAALPLIDTHSGHVGPGLLGDSDHGIHVPWLRNNDVHEHLFSRF